MVDSIFPVLIEFMNTTSYERTRKVIQTPEELPIGASFKVLKINYKEPPVSDEKAAAMLMHIGEAFIGDDEAIHSRADAYLCTVLESLGYTKTVEAFNALDKWCA